MSAQKETVRVRLDLPRALYHEARAEVERRRARGDAEVKTLSDLVATALRKCIGGEK
jgi:hypothetical protein